MSRSNTKNSPPPHELISVVRHYLPGAARYYRLRNVDSGKLLPSQGRPAHECGVFQVTPPGLLPVGTWQILYYREAFDLDSAIPPADGTRPPTVVYGNDGVLLTPADWERSEEAKQFHLERRDLSIRRETALTRMIEAQGTALERLSSHLVERDRAITENQVAMSKLQIEMLGFMRQMIEQSKASTNAQGDALVTAAKRIAEATNTLKTDNLASVGIELIKQVGTVAQAFASNKHRGGAPKTSRPHILEREPVLVATLPAGDRPDTEPFEAPPPPPAKSPACALPSEIVIAWDELFGRESVDAEPVSPLAHTTDPAPVPVSPMTDPAPAPVPLADGTDDAAMATSETTLAPPSAAAFGELPPALAELLGMMGLRAPVARPRPADWSPKWAVRKIKERIASLSEVSIAWLLSSWKNALSFLRELADIARPPDPALLIEAGSSP